MANNIIQNHIFMTKNTDSYETKMIVLFIYKKQPRNIISLIRG